MSALCVSFLLNCWYHFPSQCPLCVLYLFSALSCRVATLQISLIIVSQLAPVLNWEITDFIKSKSFELWHKLSHQNCHPGLLCGAFCGLWSSFNTCNHTDVFSSHSFHHYSDKSVHFSRGNTIFTLHACMTSVPTKLQQARKQQQEDCSDERFLKCRSCGCSTAVGWWTLLKFLFNPFTAEQT